MQVELLDVRVLHSLLYRLSWAPVRAVENFLSRGERRPLILAPNELADALERLRSVLARKALDLVNDLRPAAGFGVKPGGKRPFASRSAISFIAGTPHVRACLGGRTVRV